MRDEDMGLKRLGLNTHGQVPKHEDVYIYPRG